jgi:UDP-glucuronate 4-epimerase
MAMYIFAKKISSNEPIDVYNNGKMKRDFTFIDDIVKGTISSIEKNFPCEIFNLGNNKTENLMDVIKHIENFLGIKAKINFKPIQPGDVLETFANIEKSQNQLNYFPKININEGIQYFTDWFRSYHNV